MNTRTSSSSRSPIGAPVLWILLAVALLLQAAFSGALADGGIVYPWGYYIRESEQRAVILYDEEAQREDLYVQAGFYGDAREFAWIIPVPSIPEVAVADEYLFHEASDLTRPSYHDRGVDWGCDCSDKFQSYPADAGANGVIVYDERMVGNYAIRIVGADSSSVLADSLAAWGYLYDHNQAEIVEVLDDYIERDWVFVALRVAESSFDPDQWDGVFYGGTEPVHLSFPSEQAVFPMRISALSADDVTEVTIYICAQHRMTFEGAETRYANNVSSSELRSIRSHFPRLGAILPGPCFLTKLHRSYTPNEMDSDIVFERAGTDREFREIHYSGIPPIGGLLIMVVGVGIHLYYRWGRRSENARPKSRVSKGLRP